jgi:hypothetical protein
MELFEKTVYNPKDGKIIALISGNGEMSPEYLQGGLESLDGLYRGDEYYILSGTPTIRPITGLPETQSLNVGVDWFVTNVPENTDVEVDGELVGTTDATGLTLNFSASGIWPVVLRPPFPWLEASCEVTVT